MPLDLAELVQGHINCPVTHCILASRGALAETLRDYYVFFQDTTATLLEGCVNPNYPG